MNSPASRAEALFLAAVALKGPARKVFLDRACGTNAALRADVETLLQAHDAAEGFLETSPVKPAVETEEMPGRRLGRYVLQRKLGEGGCGVVYEAEQQEPVRRSVALKIIKPGMDTHAVIARFEAERQALALMEHPNIAKVFDAGVTDAGRPYFVMELVRGQRITDYCDEHSLSTVDRLALFTHVCQALQHAHQKGVIHRDLKPSNILVATRDDAPVPIVIDFGIAKATQGRLAGDVSFTAFDQFIGTPAYMSPEQAAPGGPDVDTRSDIYSLGALLYELLAGRPPFEPQSLLQSGLEEIRRVLREVDPPKPSARLATLTKAESSSIAQHRDIAPEQLRSKLNGDLDWIVMKALEKQRERRYETAAAFAADVARYLENQPILARPQSASYRLRKLIVRHRVAATGIAAVALAVAIGAGLFTAEFFREKAALRRAVEAEQAHRVAQQAAEIAVVRANQAEQTQSRLAAQAEAARQNEASQRAAAETSRANEAKLRIQAEAAAARAETDATRQEQVSRLMTGILKGAGPRAALGRDTRLLRDILEQTAQRLSRDLRDQPEVEAELRETLAATYFDLGDYRNAVEQRQQVLALRRAHSPVEDAAVAAALVELGRALLPLGSPAEAESYFREALALQEKHRDTEAVGTLAFLATALNQQGKTGEAEKLYRDILARRQRDQAGGPLVTSALGALGSQLAQQGRTTEAEALLRENVTRRRQETVGSIPMAVSLANLSGVLRAQGKLPEAEKALRESLALQQEALGSEHPDFVGTMISLASLLREQGNLEESERTYRSALALQRKFLDADHPDLAYTLRGLSSLLASRQQWDEAEPLLQEALSIARQRHLEIDQTLTLTKLGQLELARGKPSSAEKYLRDAAALARDSQPQSVPALIEALSALREMLAPRKSTEVAALDRELAMLRGDQIQNAQSANSTALGAIPPALPVTARNEPAPKTLPVSTRPKTGDLVEIVRVTPKRVVPGVSVTISVWVKYTLASRSDARVTLGFNTLGPTAYPINVSKLVDAGTDEIELVGTVVPVQWPNGKKFSLLVILAPDPRPPGSQSLASAVYTLDFQ